MPALNFISADKLKRLIGRPPELLLPAPVAWPFGHGPMPPVPAGRGMVVACEDGRAQSHGVAALLRQGGVAAEVLAGGVAGWAEAGFPLVPADALPRRDASGRTLWVWCRNEPAA